MSARLPVARLPVILLWWAVQMVVKIAVAIPGLVMVAFMYRYKNTPFRKVPWMFYLWKNPEDWCDGVLAQRDHTAYIDSLPPWWRDRMKDSSRFWRFYKYHAIRNPADGLRNIKMWNCKLDPRRIKYITNQKLANYEWWAHDVKPGKFYWFVAWQGLHCQLKVLRVWTPGMGGRHFALKVGHRVEPSDTWAKPGGVRHQIGASFASKFLPYRKNA